MTINLTRRLLVVFIFLPLYVVSAQQVSIKGKIVDQKDGTPLPFATIRVVGSKEGATSNREGEFELQIKKGKHKLTASYVGYVTKTIEVDASQSLNNVDFSLESSQVELKEITVFPGENPAVGIIRGAIERKKQRAEFLKSYKFGAYTKITVQTVQELLNKGGGAGTILSAGTSADTGALKITGIIENVSESYYRAPSDFKELILARRQTANIPQIANIISGGRFISNFYEDRIIFFANNNFVGPIADNALTYYYYYIEDTLSIDHKNVFKIHMEPDDPADPGFRGNLYILDKTFDLIKVELLANRVGTVADFFDTLSFEQQYFEYGEEKIYMPSDFRVSGKINYLGLFKGGIDLSTSLNSYEINLPLGDEVFGGAVVKVVSDADTKDSTFWLTYQGIPNTAEEVAAYTRIDSLQNKPDDFWDNFSLLSDRFRFGQNFSASAPLSMYHFNPVEGHSIDFRVSAVNLGNSRLNTELNLSYGFADEKFKPSFNISYLLGEYRTHRVAFRAFDEIEVLFRSNREYGKIFSTFATLLSKSDFNDYYYSKGFRFDYSGEIFPLISLDLGFQNRTDNSATVNSNVSILNGDKAYRANSPVSEMRLNEFSAGITIDPRDYIENGLNRRRLWGNFHIVGGFDFKYAPASMSSGVEYRSYGVNARMFLRTSLNTTMTVRAFGFTTEGGMPLQMLYSLPGNINGTAQNQTFRTLDLGEYNGDRGWMVFVDQNLGNLPFRLLGISALKKLNVQFNAFLNAGMIEYDKETSGLYPWGIKRLSSPLYEAGFGVSTQLIPIRFDFGWRVTHTEERPFRIGLNTVIIL